jgi:hypothetical protein
MVFIVIAVIAGVYYAYLTSSAPPRDAPPDDPQEEESPESPDQGLPESPEGGLPDHSLPESPEGLPDMDSDDLFPAHQEDIAPVEDVAIEPVAAAFEETMQDPCPEVHDPVCAADGQYFDNACYAEFAGVETATRGLCNRSANVAW